MGILHFNPGNTTFIYYLGHPLHSDSLWLGENLASEGCSWSQPGNHSHSRTLLWQAQHWGQEGPPLARSLPQSQNHWTEEGIERADSSLSGVTLTQSYFLQWRTADTSLPPRDHSSSLHSQRPKRAPEHQHPALYHPRHIATHDCFCFSLTWQTLCLNSQRICQSEHTWVHLL